jgi:SNF2 family DNA or RNA helicase
MMARSDFKKLSLPRMDLKERDFEQISAVFHHISELEVDLLIQNSTLVDVALPKTLRTLSLWNFSRRTSQNILRELPQTLQSIKFFGEHNVEFNEKTFEYLERSKGSIRQLFISNIGLKFIKQSIPNVFSSFLKPKHHIIYFGLEKYTLKHPDDYEFLIDVIIGNC